MKDIWQRLPQYGSATVERQILLQRETAKAISAYCEVGTECIVSTMHGTECKQSVRLPYVYPAEHKLKLPSRNALQTLAGYESELAHRFFGKRIRVFWRPQTDSHCAVAYVVTVR